jgi:purine nucleosidase
MRIVIDSDGGCDDAAAIVWLAGRPDVEIAAVTAVGGNVAVRQAGRNLRVILEACGRADVPVLLGRDPSPDRPHLERPVAIHGHDGLGDVGLADPQQPPQAGGAAELLATELGRGTTLLSLGPLRNVADALAADPAAVRSGARLVAMGGSARAQGNARPTAEANVAHDPAAAAAVVAAGWAVPPLLVGLDVTLAATLRAQERDLLAARRTPAAAFLAGPLAAYNRRSGTFCPPGETPVHDLLAAMALVLPDLVAAPVLPVAVDTGRSAAWGQTVVDLRVLAWQRAAAAADGTAQGGVPAGAADPTGANAAGDGDPVAVALEVDVEAFRWHVRHLCGG